MKAILFALHQDRLGGPSGSSPCALLPLMDRPFIQHVVGALAEWGVSEIILATDRAAGRFTAALGDGLRWGCPISVVPLPASDLPAYLRTVAGDDGLILTGSADQLPLLTSLPQTPTRWISADSALDWQIVAASPEPVETQVVAHHLSARTFADLLAAQRTVLAGHFPPILPAGAHGHIARSARIHPTARIAPSAWVGPRCRIGPGVTLGPNVCLGEGCVVEGGSSLTETLATAGTYVGAGLEIDGMYLDRGRLYHTRLDEALTIADGFLLGEAAPRRPFWLPRSA